MGDGVAGELARRYGIPRPAVVRNLPAARPAGEVESPLRDALGLDPAARVALYLGGLQAGRGLELLVDAARRLRAAGRRSC